MTRRTAKNLGYFLGGLFVLLAIWLGAQALAPGVNPAPPTPSGISAGGAQDVELIVLPNDGESAVTDRVARARQRVWMKMYLLTDTRLIDALKQAKANGAQVRAMIEEDPFGGNTAAKTAHERLKRAGIETKYASPAFRFTHEKSFVIDDEALILTANQTRSSVTRNREFGVVIDDAAEVAEIMSAFEADWNRAAFTPRSRDLVWSPTNSRERLIALIQSAGRTLDVYAASTQDDGVIQALADAARRGVQVRVLTSPARGEDAEDAASGDADLDNLDRGGAVVRMLKSPYVHAKVFVVDGSRAFVGSQNISATSLDFNRELGLIFVDPDAIQRLAATFQQDWDKASDRQH